MPKLESVPATEANRNGRSAATSVSCQADSSLRMSTAAPRSRLFSSSAMCSSISCSVWVRR